MKLRKPYFLFFSLWTFACCNPSTVGPESLPEFNPSPVVHTLEDGLLNDASGIVPSFNFENNLWVHNDHNADLYLINAQGQLQKRLPFAGPSRDWEDIAIGPGPEPNKNYIYIGEIGDNNEVYPDYSIYRFPEPTSGQNEISSYETIRFTYSDGKSYDVETLLLDPHTKDLYLLTKRQLTQSHVFRLPFPQNTNGHNTAQFVKSIPYAMLTGGDISANGKEILLKNYALVYYWKVRDGESPIDALDRPHDILAPYVVEPQGEGICFDKKQNGYFTISERGSSPEPVKLYYYSKK